MVLVICEDTQFGGREMDKEMWHKQESINERHLYLILKHIASLQQINKLTNCVQFKTEFKKELLHF